MTLEALISSENGVTFWKEFTFSDLKFRVPAGEVELADNLVWFGDVAIIIQMKERETLTDDPETERKWFKKKVLRDAKDQIKDSLRYLREQGAIEVGNARGQRFEVRNAELRDIKSVILYKPGVALPRDCSDVRFYESANAGFIHILTESDYRRVLATLVAPEEVRSYLSYRESSLRTLKGPGAHVTEEDILGSYVFDETLPTSTSNKNLLNLVGQDEPRAFSWLMANLADRIENPTGDTSYAKIMAEFATLPRAMWRAAKQRLDLSIDLAKKGEFARPYHFFYPRTGCAFMITPLEPRVMEEGGTYRAAYLQMLTEAALCHHEQAARAVGLQVSATGRDIMIDWCLVDDISIDREFLEKLLADGLFRPASPRAVDSFLFQADED